MRIAKGCLIAVGVFAVAIVGGGCLILVAGIALSGRSSPTTISGTPASGGAASVPTVTPAALPVARVGQRIESAGIALTVNTVRRTDALGQFMKAQPGRTYTVVDVTLENASREQAPYDPFYFKAKDGAGYEYGGTSIGLDSGLKSGELATGETVRGGMAFDLPDGASGVVLSYQPVVLFGGYRILRVALE